MTSTSSSLSSLQDNQGGNKGMANRVYLGSYKLSSILNVMIGRRASLDWFYPKFVGLVRESKVSRDDILMILHLFSDKKAETYQYDLWKALLAEPKFTNQFIVDSWLGVIDRYITSRDAMILLFEYLKDKPQSLLHLSKASYNVDLFHKYIVPAIKDIDFTLDLEKFLMEIPLSYWNKDLVDFVGDISPFLHKESAPFLYSLKYGLPKKCYTSHDLIDCAIMEDRENKYHHVEEVLILLAKRGLFIDENTSFWSITKRKLVSLYRNLVSTNRLKLSVVTRQPILSFSLSDGEFDRVGCHHASEFELSLYLIEKVWEAIRNREFNALIPLEYLKQLELTYYTPDSGEEFFNTVLVYLSDEAIEFLLSGELDDFRSMRGKRGEIINFCQNNLILVEGVPVSKDMVQGYIKKYNSLNLGVAQLLSVNELQELANEVLEGSL